jgi:hypothetical protein
LHQNEQKPAEASSQPEVETQLEEADLEVVTGGLISTGGAGAGDGSCITSTP